MRILGLVVAPWCRAVRANRMIPRALADDLTTFCTGVHAALRILHIIRPGAADPKIALQAGRAATVMIL